ncbi:hypothetical protein ACHAWF_017822 [Thalassiosira exigua]
MMASASPMSYEQIYQQRLARAVQRIRSARDRPTTALAREFFNDGRGHDFTMNRAPDRYNDDARWRSLPRRLLKLAAFLQDPSAHGVDAGDADETREQLSAAVFAQAPPSFLDDFRHLFEALLKARQKQWSREHADESMDIDEAEVESGEEDVSLLQEEDQLYQSLASLGWVSTGGQLRRPFREALHSVTMIVIGELVSGNFEEEGVLERVLQWAMAVLQPWAYSVVGQETFVQDQWEAQLEYSVSECFVHMRMKELFNLVTEYPDSLPAVRELSVALDRTGRLWYQSLANEWRNALIARLLHPGAETAQIIEVYINTIKVLREMDPSGELLQVVTQPVREYLKGRSDTIRCIIKSLTDEEGGELYEELRRQDAKPLEEAQLDEEDDEEPPTFDWEPPPSILKRRGVITGQVGRVTSSSRRAGDILAMLVGIYGSKDLFVNEYRIMLADKLLGNLEYDTDKEVHNLELLKLRFGEVSMRQCEVMIKDIDDSKRIQTNIRSTLANAKEKETPVVDAAIVSHIFWPALQREEVKNHPRLQRKLDQFSIEYAKLKNPRRLVWLKQLGTVELEVESYEEDEHGNITSHVKEVSCTPAQATLLAHFEDKSEWTSGELSTQTEMPEDIVKKRMGFWLNQRVVVSKRSGENLVYSLMSVNSAVADIDQIFQHDDEDHQQAVSIGAHEEEEMKVYESYIFGMLSNLGQLPLERIHSMLKTFVAGSDHKYDKTPQQLAVFLQQLCTDGKLECSPDGLYTRI